MLLVLVLGLAGILYCPELVLAQGRGQAARAAADFLIERFGPQAAREGVEVLARRIESLAVKHGDEVFMAVRKVGPRFFEVVEAAGANSAKAVRIMAEHGEPGVAWVLTRPNAMKLLSLHGEEAAAVLVRHPGGICEPVIEQFGAPAVRALRGVGPQGGRRLAMMLSDGELAKIGRTPELLDVVARYGDRAMEFIWKHKFTLAGTATIAVFLANPEPFISGARDITQIAAENAVKPLFEVPGKVAQEAASRLNWDLFGFVFLVLGAGLLAVVVALNSWRKKVIGVGLNVRGGSGNLQASASPYLPSVQSPASAIKPQNSRPPVRRKDVGQ